MTPFKTRTVQYSDGHEFLKYVSEIYSLPEIRHHDFPKGYSIEEFVTGADYVDEDDLDLDLEKIKSSHEIREWQIQSMLCDMGNKGLIPPGEYIITFNW